MDKCEHENLVCLNQYEYIRKYKCEDCLNIMMCLCDKEHGETFLSHQLDYGTWLETQEREPVTLGFVDSLCPECRGLKAVNAPKASMPGYTSKLKRYYWREIALETTEIFYTRHPEFDPNKNSHKEFSYPEERKAIEKIVIDKIKSEHSINPKYDYSEVTQSEVISKTSTEVIIEKAEYVKTNERKAQILYKGELIKVEEYAEKYFENKNYSVLQTESIPFHVIFGTLMSSVIQDETDPYVVEAFFGSRTDVDNGKKNPKRVSALLPTGFGTIGYYERRKNVIIEHIDNLKNLDLIFEELYDFNNGLIQYLWAHREKDYLLAKEVINILGDTNIKLILHYMAMNYWKNFCGWPDLLVYSDTSFTFVEVKSSNDKLSEDQKNWLLGNFKYMKFNAKIFKITK